MKELEWFIDKFKTGLQTETWKNWDIEIKNKITYFKSLFNLSNIKNLTEEDFIEIFKSSWAALFWTKKDWKAIQILKENMGIDNVRDALYDLLYLEKPLWQRYDQFRNRIKGLGDSFITEIMAFSNPDKYCLWNMKPKVVLPLLKLDYLFPPKVFKYQLTGKDYEKCIEGLSIIKEELKAVFENPNFVDVDHFIFFIFSNREQFGLNEEVDWNTNDKTTRMYILQKGRLEEEIENESHLVPKQASDLVNKENNSHTKAQNLLVEIGNLLGYDTYVPPEDLKKKFNGISLSEKVVMKEIPPFTNPRLIEKVKHIDVIWFKEEFPEFCFEVEDSTDVTKGLLRLYQIRQLNAKLIIVGPNERLRKFEKEIANDPFYYIKDKYRFISYEELETFYQTTIKFIEMRNRLFFD